MIRKAKSFIKRSKNRVKAVFDERGISLFELFLILGVCVVIIAATLIASEAPITSWWNNKIKIYWQ